MLNSKKRNSRDPTIMLVDGQSEIKIIVNLSRNLMNCDVLKAYSRKVL